MVGVIPTSEARNLAINQGLDLVEVSPNADPPVCRIMDFGKFRYEESRKQKDARKHGQTHSLKEIKFHANVGDHDFETKVGHVRKFLDKGHKVKVSLQFRGRENIHRELGFEVIGRAITACEDVATVEMSPRLIGRSVGTLLSPKAPKI